MNLFNKPLPRILFTLFLTGATSAYAKFGFIQDKDGYVNLRESSARHAVVIQQLKNDEIISCQMEESKSKFCFISAPDLKQNGYVYKNRINFFKGFNTVSLAQYTALKAIYKNKDIVIEVAAIPAKQEDSLYTSLDEHGQRIYKYYKDKVFFGTDGDIPPLGFLQLDQITIKYKSKVLQLNAAQLEQYFFPSISLDEQQNELADFEVFYLNDDVYIFNALNQGGAGGYNLLIQIHNGELMKPQAWREEI